MKVFWTSNELLSFGLAKLHYNLLRFFKGKYVDFYIYADGVEIVQFFWTFRASNKILTESYCKSVNLELEFMCLDRSWQKMNPCVYLFGYCNRGISTKSRQVTRLGELNTSHADS